MFSDVFHLLYVFKAKKIRYIKQCIKTKNQNLSDLFEIIELKISTQKNNNSLSVFSHIPGTEQYSNLPSKNDLKKFFYSLTFLLCKIFFICYIWQNCPTETFVRKTRIQMSM